MGYVLIDTQTTYYTTYFMITLGLMIILIWAVTRDTLYQGSYVDGLENPSALNVELGPDADFTNMPKLYTQSTFLDPDQELMDSLLMRNIPTDLQLGNYNGMAEVGVYGSVPVYMMTPYDSKNGHRWGKRNSGLYLLNNRTIWQDQERPREAEYWDAIAMIEANKLNTIPKSLSDFTPDGRYVRSPHTPEKWAK